MVWLTTQFTEAHKLLPPAGELTSFIDCGLGGSAKEKWWAGSFEALRLGAFKLSNPTTVSYQVPAIEGSDGLLGNSVLRNFEVILITYAVS